MRRIMSACALALVLAVPAFAAKVDTGKLQLPDDLTQAQAEQVMAGALVKAVEQGVPMNIAIVDAGGNLKAFCRMDGAFWAASTCLWARPRRPACSICQPQTWAPLRSPVRNCTALW